MMPKSAHPMDVLEAAVPILAAYDPQLHDESRNANFEKATRLIAKLPSIVAAWIVFEMGRSRHPRLELTHAGTSYTCCPDSLPDRTTARDFDICLILHAEHSL